MAKNRGRVRPTVAEVTRLKAGAHQVEVELDRLKAHLEHGRRVAMREGFDQRRDERKLVEARGLLVSLLLEAEGSISERLRNDVLLFLGLPQETNLQSATEKALV